MPSPLTVPNAAEHWDQRRRVSAICLVLVAITFVVFGQTLRYGFIEYDDNAYIYENPVVTQGLTFKGAVWALTYGEIGHWHPLTWLTHMADCQIYGLRAGGHHLTNVALQAAAAALLFLTLNGMTGSLWRSAFVAAVFAIHPLRVESVAWIAERKDVLSGVFFMLTLWAYARYARQPSRGRYAVVAVCFGLGLLSKNTLVTLPLVLLLLDWWPLQRLRLDVVKEKIPLFLLSVGSCVATALVPEKLLDSERIPFLERVGNAVVSYVIYVRQMVYPAGLAIPYPYPPNGEPFWKIALALAVLAAISVIVLAWRNRRPYLLVGWLWYLGMLVPMIGVIQISYYVRADRYTYLSGIGLVLAGTWAVGDWSAEWKHRRVVLGGLMAVAIGALMACAWKQTTYWKNTETLWKHTLVCTTGNNIAHLNLGHDLRQKGKVDEAITFYQKGLQTEPANAESLNNLGNVLCAKGRVDEAITNYEKALQIKPAFAEAEFNLGKALRQKGKMNEANAHFQAALKIMPDLVPARVNLGNDLLHQGKPDQAVPHLQKALEMNPNDAGVHLNLGLCFFQLGQWDAAFVQYQKALDLKPADPGIQNNLAWLLATCPKVSLRNGNKAVELARQANELTGGGNMVILHTLAAALAEAGRFPEAVETAQHALHLPEAQSNPELAGQLQSELKLYQAGTSFYGPAQTR